MKRFLLILLVFLSLSTSVSATDILVHSGDNLQTKIDSAICSDTITLDEAVTWDGTFTLPNKGCTVSTPITIRSSGRASLPSGRVGPADAAHMPRLRTLGSSLPTLRTVTNAAWWIVDGIEITDNAGSDSNVLLIDWSQNGVHDMALTRCWIHQKETGTTYTRSAIQGLGYGGDNLTFKWNYLTMIGYYKNDPTFAAGAMPTIGISANPTASNGAGISGILIEDSYIDVWYSAFFFGGSDTAPAHTATLSSGATMTSATFSNTTGLAAGVIVLLSVRFNATVSNIGTPGQYDATLTRNSGAFLTNADRGSDALNGTGRGTAMRSIGNVPQFQIGLNAVNSPGVYDVGMITTNLTVGTYDWELLPTVMIDTVNHGTGAVTYHPHGANALAQAPSTPGAAQWSVGDEGLVSDITVRKNTMYIDPAFAEFAKVNSNAGPKGWFEIKNCNRMTVEGNRFGGWPSVLAWTGSNQGGGSPWTTVRDIIVRNNWVDPLINATTTPSVRAAFIVTENQYRTGREAANLQVYNNVFKGFMGIVNFGNVNNQSFTHNTFINNTYSDYNSMIGEEALDTTGFVFSDNIVPYSRHGLWCTIGAQTIAACWNPATVSNNVVVDDWPLGVGEVNTTMWGAGGVLSPIALSFTSIGFTNLAGDILSLAVTSPYKGDGTGGTDPGVDWTALQAALTGANNPPTTGAGLDQNLGSTTSTTLMGTASDPDGDTPLTYSWVRTSGPNTPTIVSSTALTTLITGMTTGTYVFTLTVTDPDGASSSDTMSVTIAASGAVTTCRWPTNPVCQP